jgi:uncharacterized repeat protein (TIGR03806 family)
MTYARAPHLRRSPGAARLRLAAALTVAAVALVVTLIGLPPLLRADEAVVARVPGSVTISGSPDGIDPYVIVEAFPELRFERPIWVGSPPDGSDTIWVMEQGGRILTFSNNRMTKKTRVALDLRKKVLRSHNEEGLQGLAFHPQFKKNRKLFLTYSAGDPRRLVLSRFEASTSRKRIQATSEEVLLRQAQPYGNHNGGCIAFGPDEKLYLSLGDGGSHGDPSSNGQNLMNWLGTILRIDVTPKKGYEIPADNPFYRVQNAREEIWAYGLQNVRRFSFDSVTGRLWAGDVGNDKFQEIDLIEKGQNYGWNLREGTSVFKEGRALLLPKAPLLTLAGDQARRITGGVVYRGSRMPGLIGAYVYGDMASGNIWAMRTEGSEIKENLLVGRGHHVTSFGTDAGGEIYFTCFDGKVYTLAPWTGHRPKGRFPRRLSDTGLFTDVRTLAPDPALIPYSINVPLWSDGAGKSRYVMLPGMDKIHVDESGRFTYPVGTIFVKHFHFDADGSIPAAGKRLETRLFVKGERQWEGYTYVWDDKQEEAFLLDGRLDEKRSDPAVAGKDVHWTYPSRSDCMSCHTEVGGWVIGFRPEQLNRLHDYGQGPEPQLERLQKLAFFEGDLQSFAKSWPDWKQPGDRMDEAVRAYLDVNCAMCHQPDGPGNASIDLRKDTALKDTGLVDRKPGQWDLGIYQARLLAPGEPARSLLLERLKLTDEKGMPPIAHNIPDEMGMARIEAWIAALPK